MSIDPPSNRNRGSKPTMIYDFTQALDEAQAELIAKTLARQEVWSKTVETCLAHGIPMSEDLWRWADRMTKPYT